MTRSQAENPVAARTYKVRIWKQPLQPPKPQESGASKKGGRLESGTTGTVLKVIHSHGRYPRRTEVEALLERAQRRQRFRESPGKEEDGTKRLGDPFIVKKAALRAREGADGPSVVQSLHDLRPALGLSKLASSNEGAGECDP